MSRPVSTNSTWLRYPPSVFSDTFSVGGGGSPRTPLIATRSGPSWWSCTVSSRRVASGPAYRGSGHLVQQLRGHGADGDRAAGAGVLGDDAGAVGIDLGDREAGMAQVGDLGEERVVAAGGLRAALDDVPGRHRPGERVEVVQLPAEVRGCRADDERGVGHPAGDDDVRAGLQAGGDPPAAEVGVRRDGLAEAELGRSGQQVVAGHVARSWVPARAVPPGRGWLRPGRPGSARRRWRRSRRPCPAPGPGSPRAGAGTSGRSRGPDPSGGRGRGSAWSARPGSRRSARPARRPRASPASRRAGRRRSRRRCRS